MTYATHRQFAICWALIGAVVLYLQGMTQINYYLALCIVLPFAKLGAEFPDYDHHWDNVKNKTVVSWVVNKLIHMTGGVHRSWQTHSIDITVTVAIVSYLLPKKLYSMGIISEVNKEALSIILLGFSLGWLSHLFSDMLTSGKVRLFCFKDYKVGLVPEKLLFIRFNTGNEWEQFVYTVTRIANLVIGLGVLLFPFFFGQNGIIGFIKGL